MMIDVWRSVVSSSDESATVDDQPVASRILITFLHLQAYTPYTLTCRCAVLHCYLVSNAGINATNIHPCLAHTKAVRS